MADKDGDGPSLELPSLGFGRKRGKKARGVEADATAPPETAERSEPGPEREPARSEAPTTVEPTTMEEAQPERPTTQMPAAAPPLFADEARDGSDRSRTERDQETDTLAEEETAAAKPRRQFSLPALSSMTAALITGAVVGVLMVGLTGLGFRLCEVVQGTSSCGDPGFLLLVAIVVVVVIVGKTMLDAWSVTDPGSTSFLAVGLLCVVALLFLVDVLFNWWMIIVIPVVSMLSFALSHWVTTAFVETDE